MSACRIIFTKTYLGTCREATRIVEELNKVLKFNNLLISLKNHPEANRFARGVGPVSLLGKEDANCFPLVCANDNVAFFFFLVFVVIFVL